MNAYRIFKASALFSIMMIAGCNDCKEPEPCIDSSKIDPDSACIEIYQPVCGCDGVTYDNSCFAEISGVISWVEGACQN